MGVFIVVVLAALVGAFFVAPYLVQRALNRVKRHAAYPVSAESREFHASLLVADLHSDALLWNRDLLVRNSVGHVDLPRLEAGNAALQVFAACSRFPGAARYRGRSYNINVMPWLASSQRWPAVTWRSPRAAALHQSWKLHGFAERSQGRLHLIKTAGDLDVFLDQRASTPGLVAGLLSIEGLYCIEGDLANLDVLFKAGFRMASPTHFSDNETGGAANGMSAAGLTDFGRDVVARMEALRMVVDLVHASPRLIDDVLDRATRPVVVSHTGIRGAYDNERNLSDVQAVRIAEQGGLIGIGYWRDAVGAVSLDAVTHTLRYAVDLLGVEHVALGSDFDGTVPEPFDASELPALTHHLLVNGFTETEVRAIMGSNVFRFLREALPEN